MFTGASDIVFQSRIPPAGSFPMRVVRPLSEKMKVPLFDVASWAGAMTKVSNTGYQYSAR